MVDIPPKACKNIVCSWYLLMKLTIYSVDWQANISEADRQEHSFCFEIPAKSFVLCLAL